MVERRPACRIPAKQIVNGRHAQFPQPCRIRSLIQYPSCRIGHGLKSGLIARFVFRRRILPVGQCVSRPCPVIFINGCPLVGEAVRPISGLHTGRHTDVPHVVGACNSLLRPCLQRRFQTDRGPVGVHLQEPAQGRHCDILAHPLALIEVGVRDVQLPDCVEAVVISGLEKPLRHILTQTVPSGYLIHQQIGDNGVTRRLGALQSAKQFLHAVQVVVASAHPVPLHVAGAVSPNRDGVVPDGKIGLLRHIGADLRIEIEVIGQLFLGEHMQLLPLVVTPVVIPQGCKLDQPENVRLVLRPQRLIFAGIRVDDTIGEVVIQRGIGHVLQDETVELKGELVAVPPGNPGPAPLKGIRAGFIHKGQRIGRAPALNQVPPNGKGVGPCARAGDVIICISFCVQP